MDEQKKETTAGSKKTGNPNQILVFRSIAVVLVLYWLFGIVRDYVLGGPEAPSTLLLVLAIVLLGGGAISVFLLSLRIWLKARADAKAEEETALPKPEEPEE